MWKDMNMTNWEVCDSLLQLLLLDVPGGGGVQQKIHQFPNGIKFYCLTLIAIHFHPLTSLSILTSVCSYLISKHLLVEYISAQV